MGPSDIDRVLIIAHHLPQKLRPGEHRDLPLLYRLKFQVIRMDGRRIDHHIDVLRDVRCPLPVGDLRAHLLQMLGQLGLMGVRTRYPKALLQEDLRQPAHTDAPDPDKMYSFRFVEINLIHIFLFPALISPIFIVCHGAGFGSSVHPFMAISTYQAKLFLKSRPLYRSNVNSSMFPSTPIARISPTPTVTIAKGIRSVEP